METSTICVSLAAERRRAVFNNEKLFIVEVKGDDVEFYGPYTSLRLAAMAKQEWIAELTEQLYPDAKDRVNVHRLHPPNPPGQ